MKKTILFLCFLGTAFLSKAQFGISAGYQSFKADDWFSGLSDIQQENVGTQSSYKIGIDYWFRLKNIRIEFMPELSTANFEKSFTNGDFEVKMFNLQFNTNIYLLDINNDCNCPTFSKQSNFLAKGFFLQISPGYSFINTAHNHTIIEGNTSTFLTTEKNNFSNFSIGIGAGFDLGVSDILTITPIARIRYFPNASTQVQFGTFEPTESTITQLYLGARLGFRLVRDW